MTHPLSSPGPVSEPDGQLAPRVCGARLHALFQAELATLEDVLKTLDGERRALLANDPEGVERATAAKSVALDRHAAQQRERIAWMQSQRLAATTSIGALVDYADAAVKRETLTQARTGLTEMATRCDLANRRNGALIQRLQERTRRALSVLRGSADDGRLYSVSGAQAHGSDRRTLGKA